MNHSARIVHEDGTPFADGEWQEPRCPDCDALSLSAPKSARRAEKPEPIWAGVEHETVVVRKRPTASALDKNSGPITLPDSPNERTAKFIDLIPVRCPRHVLRPHPWISAIKLQDLDDEILANFVRGQNSEGRVVVPMLAGPSYFPKGFCYEDREFSQEEIHAEIERRKGQPARVENAMRSGRSTMGSALPNCGGGGRHRRKKSFATEAIALTAARFINGRAGVFGVYVMQPYCCTHCGNWHLSSRYLNGETPNHHNKFRQRVEASDTIQPAIEAQWDAFGIHQTRRIKMCVVKDAVKPLEEKITLGHIRRQCASCTFTAEQMNEMGRNRIAHQFGVSVEQLEKAGYFD
jgi:hypothetical protein